MDPGRWPTAKPDGRRFGPLRPLPPRSPASSSADAASIVQPFDVQAFHLKDRCFEQAELLLVAHDPLVERDRRTKLARASSASVQRASVDLARHARGEVQTGDPVPIHVAIEDLEQIATRLIHLIA